MFSRILFHQGRYLVCRCVVSELERRTPSSISLFSSPITVQIKWAFVLVCLSISPWSVQRQKRIYTWALQQGKQTASHTFSWSKLHREFCLLAALWPRGHQFQQLHCKDTLPHVPSVTLRQLHRLPFCVRESVADRNLHSIVTVKTQDPVSGQVFFYRGSNKKHGLRARRSWLDTRQGPPSLLSNGYLKLFPRSKAVRA